MDNLFAILCGIEVYMFYRMGHSAIFWFALINGLLNVISDYFVYYRIPEEFRSPNYSGSFEPNPLWVLLWGLTAVVAIVLLVLMIVWHYD